MRLDLLRARAQPAAAVAVLVALGVAYALRVPLGLPYDEPSHWQNVLYLADTGRLPVVGGDDVSYEAVQGPLSYVLDAAVLRVLEPLGLSGASAEHAVRLLQIPWLVGAFLLLVALLGRLRPGTSDGARTVAALAAVGTPVVLAVGSSVQNDLAALTLCLAALLALARAIDHPGHDVRDGVVLGVLTGLAFLAKATVWPIGVVVVGVLLARRRVGAAVGTTAVGLAVSGWWVVRNLVLYDSVTGTNAVAAAGYDFPPSGWNGPGSVVELGRAAVTFLWLPVEYWRNAIDAPTAIAAVAVLATVGLVALGATLKPSRDAAMLATVALAVLCLVIWIVTTVVFTNASVRLAYPALALWAVVVLRAIVRWPPAGIAVLVVLATLHAWALAAA